jgi:hypothetical protein
MASLNHHRIQDTLIREILAYLAFWDIARNDVTLQHRISRYSA